MNSYEQRQEEKRARLLARANKAREEADRRHKVGHDALKVIPFGQPILIDHYSAKRDIAYRKKAMGNIEKSFELQEKAEYYERRAESVGTGGISSDDPEAIQKLRDKLARLETAHEMMKSQNYEARAKGEQAPFAQWALSNSNATMRTVKKRIEELQKRDNMEAREDIVRDTFTIKEDKEDNRIHIIFKSIPAAEIRTVLKRNGFKWSPTRGAWVRLLNEASRYAVKRILETINQ